jgi:hypothetical protein
MAIGTVRARPATMRRRQKVMKPKPMPLVMEVAKYLGNSYRCRGHADCYPTPSWATTVAAGLPTHPGQANTPQQQPN